MKISKKTLAIRVGIIILIVLSLPSYIKLPFAPTLTRSYPRTLNVKINFAATNTYRDTFVLRPGITFTGSGHGFSLNPCLSNGNIGKSVVKSGHDYILKIEGIPFYPIGFCPIAKAFEGAEGGTTGNVSRSLTGLGDGGEDTFVPADDFPAYFTVQNNGKTAQFIATRPSNDPDGISLEAVNTSDDITLSVSGLFTGTDGTDEKALTPGTKITISGQLVSSYVKSHTPD